MKNSYITKRLILKPIAVEDAPFILKLFNTPGWHKYIGDRKVYTVEDAEKYIQKKMLPQYHKLGFGNYTLRLKESLTPIGTCGLYDREGLEGVDIGFALLPAYEKLGYAYEAARKIMDLAFNVFGLKRIQAITVTDNYSSQKLIEKLGLRFIKHIRLPDDDAELMLYSIIVSDDQ